MVLAVTSGVMETLRVEARHAGERECCGILLGRGDVSGDCLIDDVLIADNVADDPRLRFEIDPAVLLGAHRRARGGGAAVIGYYHSHPAGHPIPSATDCEHSTGDLRIWAIIAGRQVAFWRDRGNGFEELTCQVVEG
jgi:Predicted metal-dependent protease of the PAD1/JAB1 superfamily